MKSNMNLKIFTLAFLLPLAGFAKVSDFDAMINDNMKAQSELHSSVKTNLQAAQQDTAEAQLKAPREKIVVLDPNSESYNAPTKKDMLAFKKERRNHRVSEEKQFDRLANEIRANED